MPKSAKLQKEEAAKPEARIPELPEIKRDKKVVIRPIKCFNAWLIVMPFYENTELVLPNEAEYLNQGVVCGSSETIMAPSGAYVPSQFKPGDTIMFAKQSEVDRIKSKREPYAGRLLILISERNVICQVNAPIGVEIEVLPDKMENFFESCDRKPIKHTQAAGEVDRKLQEVG